MTVSDEFDQYWLTPKEHSGKTHSWRRLSLNERHRREIMRDFYGDLADNEILAKLSPSVSCHDLMPQVFAKIKKDNTTPLQILQKEWGQYVGENLAKVIFPVNIYRSRLLIQVQNSSLLYVLNNEYKEIILSKIQDFNLCKISEIRFVVAGRLDAKANYK